MPRVLRPLAFAGGGKGERFSPAAFVWSSPPFLSPREEQRAGRAWTAIFGKGGSVSLRPPPLARGAGVQEESRGWWEQGERE